MVTAVRPLAAVPLCEPDASARDSIDGTDGNSIGADHLHVLLDLAPMVGANLDVMETDARRMRGTRPFVFSNLKSGKGVDEIAHFILQKGGLAATDLSA